MQLNSEQIILILNEMELQLLVLNNAEEEVFVPFDLDLNTISGSFNDPDDDSVINLVIYGTSFTVKKNHQLMAYLNKSKN